MDTHDKKVMKMITDLTKELAGYVPVELPMSSDAVKRFGLAKVYSEKGARDYLISVLKTQRDAMGDAVDLKGVWIQKGRMEMVAEILRTSKQMFDESQRLEKTLIKE